MKSKLSFLMMVISSVLLVMPVSVANGSDSAFLAKQTNDKLLISSLVDLREFESGMKSAGWDLRDANSYAFTNVRHIVRRFEISQLTKEISDKKARSINASA